MSRDAALAARIERLEEALTASLFHAGCDEKAECRTCINARVVLNEDDPIPPDASSVRAIDVLMEHHRKKDE